MLCEALGAEVWACDLSAAQAGYVDAFAGYAKSSPWSEGQLLCVLRTPALCTARSPCCRRTATARVVVGTTNRDEGAYLGFFGKASDAMVDLQPISDLHKSEVRAPWRGWLGVPAAVVDAEPSGDVWDGRDDDGQMIGAALRRGRARAPAARAGTRPAVVAAIARPTAPRSAQPRRRRRAAPRPQRPQVRGRFAGRAPRRPPSRRSRAAGPTTLSGARPSAPGGRGRPGEWEPPADRARPGFDRPRRSRTLDRRRAARPRRAEPPRTAPACSRRWTPRGRRCRSGSPATRALGRHRLDAGDGVGPEPSPRSSGPSCRRVVPSVRFLDRPRPTDGHATPARARATARWRVVGLSPVLRFMRYEAGGRHLATTTPATTTATARRTRCRSCLPHLDSDAGARAAPPGSSADGQEALPVARARPPRLGPATCATTRCSSPSRPRRRRARLRPPARPRRRALGPAQAAAS